MKNVIIWTILLFVLSSLMLNTCSSLPEELRGRGEKFPKEIETTLQTVSKKEAHYNSFTKTKDFTLLEPYAKKEQWQELFPKAKAKAAEAKKLYNDVIAGILDDNDEEDAHRLRALLKQSQQMLSDAVMIASKPKKRADYLLASYKNRDAIIKEVDKASKFIEKSVTQLAEVKTSTEKAFPEKKDGIEDRFKVIQKAFDHAESAQKTAHKQYEKKQMDIAQFMKSVEAVKEVREKLPQLIDTYKKDLNSLSKSYSKILIDMKVEFFVQIGRTSWNENSDWPTEHNIMYPKKKVSEEAFRELSKKRGAIATFYGRRRRLGILSSTWNELSIDPFTSWPSRYDNAAEFWINDVEMKYFHKYKIVENGKTREKGYEKVDEDFFEKHMKNLGMTIVAKPYGAFEDESLTHAAPPGMAYVGNKRYGRWEKDSSGNRFWVWYGQYMFFSHMLFGHRYSYNSWNSWNRGYMGRRAYYGPRTAPRRWGTNSNFSKKHYSRSWFGRHGGFKMQRSSIRGAGRSRRGRGPGGFGK